MPGVHQHDLERTVLEQEVERLPVVTGRLHHHQRDFLSDQMLTQRQDLARESAPRRDRGHRLVPASAGYPDADLRVPFRHIQSRASRVNHLHQNLPARSDTFMANVRSEESKEKQKSDARAQGNNPRFPREALHAMLTYRLTGTTEAVGVDRNGHRKDPQTPARHASPNAAAAHSESSRTTTSPRGSNLLTWTYRGRWQSCVRSGAAEKCPKCGLSADSTARLRTVCGLFADPIAILSGGCEQYVVLPSLPDVPPSSVS